MVKLMNCEIEKKNIDECKNYLFYTNKHSSFINIYLSQ